MFLSLMALVFANQVVESTDPLPDCDPLFGSSRHQGLRKLVDDYLYSGTNTDKIDKRNAVIATYGNIEDWNMSQVTNLAYVFSDFDNFNANISSWDVSNVNTLKYTFYNAYNFNSNISNFCCSKANSRKNA